MGSNIVCIIYCTHRITEQIYTLQTWFPSGMGAGKYGNIVQPAK